MRKDARHEERHQRKDTAGFAGHVLGCQKLIPTVLGGNGAKVRIFSERALMESKRPDWAVMRQAARTRAVELRAPARTPHLCLRRSRA